MQKERDEAQAKLEWAMKLIDAVGAIGDCKSCSWPRIAREFMDGESLLGIHHGDTWRERAGICPKIGCWDFEPHEHVSL